MAKKIGLISVRNYNYGSILQAYAFQTLLFGRGIDNEIIYYEKKNNLKQIIRVFNIPLLRAKIKNVIRRIYCYVDRDINSVMYNRYLSFSDFVEKKLVFSEKYIGRSSLIKGTKKYSAFVLGSDQVWNPMNLGSDFYTMSFCPKNKLKVTYASSFGVSSIPRYQIRKTKQYLADIKEISVREDSGANIIKDIVGRDVPVVVDPTLLFDAEEWLQLIPGNKIFEEPYIFVYFVGSTLEHRQIVKKLSHVTGCRVVGIPYVDELVKEDEFMIDYEQLNIGPEEFVNMIRYAEYVCTDSFHATLFSIQYQKKFFVFDRYNKNDKESMNTRLYSILSKLGLEKRLISQRGNILEWHEENIDYFTVMEALKKLRIDSEVYLDKICEMLKSTV